MKTKNSRTGSRSALFIRYFLTILVMATLSGPAIAEKINLNSADAETLQYIPGIGPAKSNEIIQLRTANKGFKAVEDLLAVPGIGLKTLEVIKKHGAVDSGVSTLTDEMRENPPKKISSSNKAEQNTSG